MVGRHPRHRRRQFEQLVRDDIERLDGLLGPRENDGALGARDEEGHEALRRGADDADLLVQVGEVPLRGPEDLAGTIKQRSGGR